MIAEIRKKDIQLSYDCEKERYVADDGNSRFFFSKLETLMEFLSKDI